MLQQWSIRWSQFHRIVPILRPGQFKLTRVKHFGVAFVARSQQRDARTPPDIFQQHLYLHGLNSVSFTNESKRAEQQATSR